MNGDNTKLMIFPDARRKPIDNVDIVTAQGRTAEVYSDECLSFKQHGENPMKNIRLKCRFLF